MAEDESQPQSPDASLEAQAAQASGATDAGAPAQVPTDAPAVVDYGTEELALPNPTILTAIGLLLLSVVIFLPTLHARPTWLDDVSLTDNPLVQTTGGVARFWTGTDRAGRYQPMTLTSFWLGIRFFHNSLPAQHLISILLHAAVVILLWTLLRRLDVLGAAFAAAMFAVHPIHMQAVAWPSGRSVVLASAFYLASMLVYLRFLGLTPAAEVKTLFTLPPEPERLWGLSFVLFLCAIFSNAAASVMFPVAILLLLWWKREKVAAREWLGLLPFFLAAIAGAIWVGWLQANAFATEAITAAFGKTPAVDRIFIGLRAIWFYAVKIILPFPLIFDYPRWAASVGLGAIYGVLLIAALGVLWTLRPQIGRAPLIAALLFVVAILPMLNLLDPPAIRYSFVADNRQYLASAALIVLIAAVGTEIVHSDKLRQALNPAFCAAAVLVVLAVLTFHQGTIYLSNDRLWSETISDNSQSLLAMEEYADALLDQGRFDAAKAWFGKAQSLAPNDPCAAVGLGTVAAAGAYEAKAAGHPELAKTQQTSARQYFNDAIRVDPD
jgi:tetratricopeptide (TPR) repeat protein